MNFAPLPELKSIHPVKLYPLQLGTHPIPTNNTIIQKEGVPIHQPPGRTVHPPQRITTERVVSTSPVVKQAINSGELKQNQHRYYFVNNPQSKEVVGNYADIRLLSHSPPLRLVTHPIHYRIHQETDGKGPPLTYGPLVTRNQRILSIPTITQVPIRQPSHQQINNNAQIKTEVRTVPSPPKIRAQHVRIIPQTIRQAPQIIQPIVHPVVQPVPVFQPILQPMLKKQIQVKPLHQKAHEASKNKAMKVKLMPNRFDFDFETRESKILPTRRLESPKVEQKGTVFKIKIKKKSPPKNVIIQYPDSEAMPAPKQPQPPFKTQNKPSYMDKLKIFQDQQLQHEPLIQFEKGGEKQITHPQAVEKQSPKLTRVVLKRQDQQIFSSIGKPLQKNFKKLDRKHNQLHLINDEYELANQSKPPVRSHIDSKKVLQLFQSQIKSKPFKSELNQSEQRLELIKNQYLLEDSPQQQTRSIFLNTNRIQDRKEMEIRAQQQLLNHKAISHSGYLKVNSQEKVKEKVILQSDVYFANDLQRGSHPIYLHNSKANGETQLELQNNQYVSKDSQQPISYRLPLNYGKEKPRASLHIIQDQQVSIDQEPSKAVKLHLNSQGRSYNKLELKEDFSKNEQEFSYKNMHLHINSSKKPLNNLLRLQTDQQSIQGQRTERKGALYLNSQQNQKELKLTLPGHQFQGQQEPLQNRCSSLFLNNKQRKPSKVYIKSQSDELSPDKANVPGKQQLNLNPSSPSQSITLQEAVYLQSALHLADRKATLNINHGKQPSRKQQIHTISPQQYNLVDKAVQDKTLNLRPRVQSPQRLRLVGAEQVASIQQIPQSYKMFVNQRQPLAKPFILNKTSQLMSQLVNSPKQSSFVNADRSSDQSSQIHAFPKQIFLNNQQKTLSAQIPLARKKVLNKEPVFTEKKTESPKLNSSVAPYQTTTSQYQEIQVPKYPLKKQVEQPILEQPKMYQARLNQDAESLYIEDGMDYYAVPQYQYVYPQCYPAYYPEYYQGEQQSADLQQEEPVYVQQLPQHYQNYPYMQMPTNIAPAAYPLPINLNVAPVAAGYQVPSYALPGYAAGGYVASGYTAQYLNQGMYMQNQAHGQYHSNNFSSKKNLKIEYQYELISDDSSEDISIHQEGKKLTQEQFKVKIGQLIDELYEQRWERACPKPIRERMLRHVIERMHRGQQLNIQALVDQAQK